MLNKQITEFRGRAGQYVWKNIADHLHLVNDCDELHTDRWLNYGPYSPETRARLMTFFQIMAYGPDANKFHSHEAEYADGKLGRNQYLVDRDPRIISIATSYAFQFWRVEKSPDEFVTFSTGYAVGGSIVYPLNRDAAILYDNNELPPFNMREEHFQLQRRKNGPAAAAFIGAAVSLHGLHGLLDDEELEPGEAIGPCARQIQEQVLDFIPMIDVKGRRSTLRLVNRVGGPLPKIFTAFSRQDSGMALAIKVGFVCDEDNKIDANSNDYRYELDFNAFNDWTTEIERQKAILDGWAWFLECRDTKDAARLSKRLRQGCRELVNEQKRSQWQNENHEKLMMSLI